MDKSQASGTPVTIYTLPALVLFLGSLLTISFTILILSIVAGFQQGSALLHPNLFAAYVEVWPGQPIASVAAYAHHAPERQTIWLSGNPPKKEFPELFMHTVQWAAADPADRSILCTSSPTDGTFHQMQAVIVEDRVQVLTLESSVLQADALFLYWGAPDGITSENSDQPISLMRWDRGTYSGTASVQEPGSVVKSLTLALKQ
jgi:hypothetical protein